MLHVDLVLVFYVWCACLRSFTLLGEHSSGTPVVVFKLIDRFTYATFSRAVSCPSLFLGQVSPGSFHPSSWYDRRTVAFADKLEKTGVGEFLSSSRMESFDRFSVQETHNSIRQSQCILNASMHFFATVHISQPLKTSEETRVYTKCNLCRWK